MAKIIPRPIKSKVIEQWLEGIPRDVIARNNGIGAGTASEIIKTLRQGRGMPDIDLLRQVAVKVRKEGFQLLKFAIVVRLSNFLDRIRISEEQMEDMMEDLSANCFKLGIAIEDFVSIRIEIKNMAAKVGIPIEDLSPYINKKSEELQSLREDLKTIRIKIDQASQESGITMHDLEDDRKKRPLDQETIRSFREKLRLAISAMDQYWKDGTELMMKCARLEQRVYLIEQETEQVNADLRAKGQPELERDELQTLLFDVLHRPSKYIDIIIRMRNNRKVIVK